MFLFMQSSKLKLNRPLRFPSFPRNKSNRKLFLRLEMRERDEAFCTEEKTTCSDGPQSRQLSRRDDPDWKEKLICLIGFFFKMLEK